MVQATDTWTDKEAKSLRSMELQDTVDIKKRRDRLRVACPPWIHRHANSMLHISVVAVVVAVVVVVVAVVVVVVVVAVVVLGIVQEHRNNAPPASFGSGRATQA